MRHLSLLSAILFAAAALTAADVSGRWSGTWEQSPDGGPGPHFMILQQSGETVTGTAGPVEDRQLKIQNGKMQADKLTFEIQLPGGPLMKFTFKIQGETATGECDMQETVLKLQAKRLK